ncbi:hypothetical protein BDP55DRAFT_638364 [Colletotrichum godetiae]|uniref:Uncharacterized protein n=1 Tax=Colletotrichum godetiae TaxID=1209918 RepID=A0AAJ0EQR5_9PEZI|nr:uncharacterized protein BDP55DRAFT_638364 [Colletotrichum godetiae]KAK1657844.1 hypothetical protein BDP55DRAFT_638364 [Colletotrichum godetiae]
MSPTHHSWSRTINIRQMRGRPIGQLDDARFPKHFLWLVPVLAYTTEASHRNSFGLQAENEEATGENSRPNCLWRQLSLYLTSEQAHSLKSSNSSKYLKRTNIEPESVSQRMAEKQGQPSGSDVSKVESDISQTLGLAGALTTLVSKPASFLYNNYTREQAQNRSLGF